MDIRWHTLDPMPEAERGTLEYAASAAGCIQVVRIELHAGEPYLLLTALQKLNSAQFTPYEFSLLNEIATFLYAENRLPGQRK